MARRRPAELLREVVEPDRALRAGFEIAELDLAVGQLVADDHREVGPVPSRGLELSTEFADGEIGAGRQPLRAKRRRDPQP